MMSANDIHVSQDRAKAWLVTERGRLAAIGNYRKREHAMALARAVAYGRHLEMVVHETDGSVVRHTRTSLTYPTSLV